MAAQINNSFQVAEAELAYLVLNYLEEKGWKKTVGSMRREAKDLLRAGSQRFAVGTIPKPLSTIVSEYLQLTYKETQRTMLQRNNPLAQSIYSLLDFTAGGAAMGRPGNNNNNFAVNANMQQQQQMQMMYPQQQQQQQQQIPGAIGVGGMIPALAGGNTNNINNIPNQQGQRQPPLTPGGRHAQRKGAPKKRRRLDTDFETTNAAGGFPPSQPMMPFNGSGYYPPSSLFNTASMNGNMSGSLPTMNNSIDPLNNGECSLFGDGSFDFNFFGAVDEEAMLQFGNMVADNINKTAQETQKEYRLTDYILEDPESAGFLNKLVSAHPMHHPIIDPNFIIGSNAAAAAAAGERGGSGLPPSTMATQQGQERPSTRQSTQQQQQPTPLSPLGGSRLGKRKNTPTKKATTRSGSEKNEQSPAAPKQAVAEERKKSDQTVADEIKEYLAKPDEFEDLINECIG